MDVGQPQEAVRRVRVEDSYESAQVGSRGYRGGTTRTDGLEGQQSASPAPSRDGIHFSDPLDFAFR
jgi:hypothetical protein